MYAALVPAHSSCFKANVSTKSCLMTYLNSSILLKLKVKKNHINLEMILFQTDVLNIKMTICFYFDHTNSLISIRPKDSMTSLVWFDHTKFLSYCRRRMQCLVFQTGYSSQY